MKEEHKENLINLAIRFYKAKCYEKAIEACEKALAIDSSYTRAYHGTARSLVNLHRYKEALVMFDKAIAIEQNNSQLYEQRGDVYYTIRDYVSASNDYYRAIVCDPRNEGAIKKKARVNEYVNHMPYPSSTNEEKNAYYDEIEFIEPPDPRYNRPVNFPPFNI